MNMMISLCERTEPDNEVGISPPRPASILFTDEERFCDWIAHAAPGANTVYFRGHLAYDRMPSTNTFREPKRKAPRCRGGKGDAGSRGRSVHLVQRRHGPYDYSYLAVKAHVRRPGRWIPAGAMAGL